MVLGFPKKKSKKNPIQSFQIHNITELKVKKSGFLKSVG